MTAPRRIAAVSTSRADFGLIAPLLEGLRQDPAFDLKLVVGRPKAVDAGSDGFDDVAALGFRADYKFELDAAADDARTAAEVLARSTQDFARAIAATAPELIVLPGDRYEMLGAVSAALLARIPAAHIFGGDVTEGAVDDAVRHALTKLSHLHFCTNAASRNRILQMGEDPARVIQSGSPALDALTDFTPMPRDQFFDAVGLKPYDRACLITHHPATLGDATPCEEIREVLAALTALGPDVGLLFTGVNIDPGHALIARKIWEFAETAPNARTVETLGRTLYFNALSHMDVVVGNSSSGLYEAPSFRTPAVNIGPRQDGRLRAASVIDCAAERGAILAGLRQAFAMDCSNVENPYGDGRAVPRIIEALKSVSDWSVLTRKTFHALA